MALFQPTGEDVAPASVGGGLATGGRRAFEDIGDAVLRTGDPDRVGAVTPPKHRLRPRTTVRVTGRTDYRAPELFAPFHEP